MNLTLTIGNGEGSIFFEEDKLGFRMAQGNGIEEGYSTGEYFEGYIYPRTIVEDGFKVAIVTAAGVVICGAVIFMSSTLIALCA